jgi:hypothetical protein
VIGLYSDFRGIGAGCGWDSAWLIVEYKTSALKKQVADDDDTSFIHMHI